MQQQVLWQPNPGPQTAYVRCPIFEVFFGGARGGGKTEGSLGDWAEHAHTYGDAATGIFVRRKLTQLEEVIARARQIFIPLGFKYREQKHEFEAPNGARLKMRYLERDSDADEYQGHNYTRVYVEEATNFPSPEPINKLRATLRSARGVPVGIRLTGNPGGPGHAWVKARYIEPGRNPLTRRIEGFKIFKEKFHNPFTKQDVELERVFIPSKISDNKPLMENDPLYVARLQQQGSKTLVKAWLDGDWDLVLGAFFDCFDASKHVKPAEWLSLIPKDAPRFRAFDWGSAKPFNVGWYAISDGTWGLPRGALLKYREWYGSNGQPNVGLKLDAPLVAEGIKERERGERMQYGVADPQIFVRDGGPSIAERMLIKGISFKKGDRKRIVGWDKMREYLVGDGIEPMLYFLETCDDSIRTIPALPHDEHNSEDIDTEAEDHCGDETRYACMSRPWLKPREEGEAEFIPPTEPIQQTMGALREKHFARRREEREEMDIGEV